MHKPLDSHEPYKIVTECFEKRKEYLEEGNKQFEFFNKYLQQGEQNGRKDINVNDNFSKTIKFGYIKDGAFHPEKNPSRFGKPLVMHYSEFREGRNHITIARIENGKIASIEQPETSLIYRYNNKGKLSEVQKNKKDDEVEYIYKYENDKLQYVVLDYNAVSFEAQTAVIFNNSLTYYNDLSSTKPYKPLHTINADISTEKDNDEYGIVAIQYRYNQV